MADERYRGPSRRNRDKNLEAPQSPVTPVIGPAGAHHRLAYPSCMTPVQILATTERPVLLDTVLSPHRSLGPLGFRLLMAVITGFCLAVGIFFASIGAWPVFAFLGLDLLLVFLAFRWSYRSGRQHERIRLDSETLEITQARADGRARLWKFQPYWLRIDFDPSGDPDKPLRLSSHGRSLVIGAFLAPEERARCARLLRDAIKRWHALPPGTTASS